jgi:hypothetical protein
MSDKLTSVDEFLNARKDFVKSGDVLVKASSAGSTWDPEKRSMSFVMSAEVEDRDRDIVYQSGLTVDEFLKNPVGFFNHRSYGRPHGTWSDIQKINGRPKRTEGKFTCAPEGVNPDADALALDMGAGLIKACSIGFRPKAVKKREIPDDKKDLPYYWPGYDILEAELLECSPCTIPSNPAALAKAAASGNVIARELIEEVLDNWHKDPATGLLMKRSDFEAAHKDATGNRISVTVKTGEFVVKGLDEVRAAVAKAQEVVDALKAASEGLIVSSVETTDEAASQDDANAVKGDLITEGTVTADQVDPDKIDSPVSARSFLRKLLDLAFGEENRAKMEQELRTASAADEQAAADEAARQEALQKRRDELAKRFQAISTRAEEKGLV